MINSKHCLMGALALILILCFISSATVINSDNTDNSQDIVLGDPIDFGEIVFYFDTNGGTLEVGSGFGEVELEVGDNYRLYTTFTGYVLPTPTKDGYIFAGWYFDESFTDPFQTSDAVDGSHMPVLYAKWIKAPTDGTVLSDDGRTLITAPSNAVDYIIPETVETVAGYAFFKCNNMQSITFPESVKTLEAHTFDGLGLITVYIPYSATYMDQVPPFFNIIRTYPAPTADNYSSHNTFEIRTSDDLKNFSLASNISGNTYEGKTVYLASNLDMTNVSMGSIGVRSDSQFKGTFDGQGHVISNLEISMSGGLFYYIAPAGLVKNLGLYNCYMHGEGSQNSVFATENYGTIRNCYANECSVSWGGIDSHGAGFVYSNSGLIENCYSNTSCNGDNTLCAGNDGTITNTYYLQDASHNGIGIGKTAEEMKDPNFATLLGNAYAPDTENVNNGYPVFAPVSTEFTVSFETNGGSEVASQVVNNGENAVKPADPTKQGYVFGGWYIDAALTDEYTFTTPVTENITLYAKWYDEVVFDSVPSINDIIVSIEGRSVSLALNASNYTKILWDMGDGSDQITTYQPALTYTYETPGNYEIKATAVNNAGESESVNYNVEINEENQGDGHGNIWKTVAVIILVIILCIIGWWLYDKL